MQSLCISLVTGAGSDCQMHDNRNDRTISDTVNCAFLLYLHPTKSVMSQPIAA